MLPKEQRLQLAEMLRHLSMLIETDQLNSIAIGFGDSTGYTIHHAGDSMELGFMVRQLNFHVEHAMFSGAGNIAGRLAQ